MWGVSTQGSEVVAEQKMDMGDLQLYSMDKIYKLLAEQDKQ